MIFFSVFSFFCVFSSMVCWMLNFLWVIRFSLFSLVCRVVLNVVCSFLCDWCRFGGIMLFRWWVRLFRWLRLIMLCFVGYMLRIICCDCVGIGMGVLCLLVDRCYFCLLEI